jgi:hypothetical protein
MATEAAGRRRTEVPVRAMRRSTETKHSSKTTELYALIAAVVGVLVAAQVTDDLTARWAWILVSALAIGYMLSRGLAKSGSDEPYVAHDDGDRL